MENTIETADSWWGHATFTRYLPSLRDRGAWAATLSLRSAVVRHLIQYDTFWKQKDSPVGFRSHLNFEISVALYLSYISLFHLRSRMVFRMSYLFSCLLSGWARARRSVGMSPTCQRQMTFLTACLGPGLLIFPGNHFFKKDLGHISSCGLMTAAHYCRWYLVSFSFSILLCCPFLLHPVETLEVTSLPGTWPSGTGAEPASSGSSSFSQIFVCIAGCASSELFSFPHFFLGSEIVGMLVNSRDFVRPFLESLFIIFS